MCAHTHTHTHKHTHTNTNTHTLLPHTHAYPHMCTPDVNKHFLCSPVEKNKSQRPIRPHESCAVNRGLSAGLQINMLRPWYQEFAVKTNKHTEKCYAGNV